MPTEDTDTWEWVGDPEMGPRYCSRCQRVEERDAAGAWVVSGHAEDCPGSQGVPPTNG